MATKSLKSSLLRMVLCGNSTSVAPLGGADNLSGVVGLVKNALNKTIWCGFLSWTELEEVLCDVEITVNNRPLCYVQDDVALPTITPNLMMFPQSNILPDLPPHHNDDANLRHRAKHLCKCKVELWKKMVK